MHLLYVDESGSINKEDKPFILCGLLLSPFQSKQIEMLFDEKISDLRHNYPLEIHGSEIYNRRDSWRSVKMNKPERIAFMHEIYEIIANNSLDVIIHVEQHCENESQLIKAYATFFEQYEKYTVANDIELSQIVMDKGKYTDVIQQLFLKRSPTILDVPFEVDSKYSRAIQAADMVAYLKAMQVNKKLWSGKGFVAYFEKVEHKFGVSHLTQNEKVILAHYKNGLTRDEISKLMRMTPNVIDSTLQDILKYTRSKTINEAFEKSF